jgi:hypothetical protein
MIPMDLRRLRSMEQLIKKLFSLLREDVTSPDRLAHSTGFALRNSTITRLLARQLPLSTTTALTLAHRLVFAALVLVYIRKNGATFQNCRLIAT